MLLVAIVSTMMCYIIYLFVTIVLVVFFTSNGITMDNITHSIFDIFSFTISAYSLFIDNVKKCKNVPNNTKRKVGDIAIVTEGSHGIGECVVKDLLKYGYHVIIGTKNLEAGRELSAKLKKENPLGTTEVIQLDVGSVKSVKNFVAKVQSTYSAIHLLVNTADLCVDKFNLNDDGFESHIAVNYLGPFLLTHLLMSTLKGGGEVLKCSRVINLSSPMHIMSTIDFADMNMTYYFNSRLAYSRSKLAQIMFTRYLNRLNIEENIPVRIYAAHPGIVASDMFTKTPETKNLKFLSRFFKTIEEGAVSVLHCCYSSELENPGGNYISNCEEGYTTAYSKRIDEQQKLFNLTCKMLNIKKFGVE